MNMNNTKKSYKIKQGVNQWVVYHWDDKRGIYQSGSVLSYSAACAAVRGL